MVLDGHAESPDDAPRPALRAEEGLPGQGGENTSSDGCSDINIGNFQATPGQLVPRKIINVIEGPIIQENKCK